MATLQMSKENLGRAVPPKELNNQSFGYEEAKLGLPPTGLKDSRNKSRLGERLNSQELSKIVRKRF